MKNYIKLLSFFLVLASLQSCESDDEYEGCIYIDKRYCDPDFVLPDIVEGIVELDNPITDYDEKVLLEDFTGFRCVNCPPATVTAQNIKAQYPDRLSIVGVHCTSTFAAPLYPNTDLPFSTDFRTPEGEEFVGYYNLASLPNGSINRNGYTAYTNWAQRVSDLMADNNPEVYISIENITVDEANQQIILDGYAKPLIQSDVDYFINMSVTENNIQEGQKDVNAPGGEILDYIHNHVYRGSAYGAWGIEIFNGNIDLLTQEVLSFKLKMDINPVWKLEDCEVLVFISYSTDDENNRQVVQVEEAHLMD